MSGRSEGIAADAAYSGKASGKRSKLPQTGLPGFASEGGRSSGRSCPMRGRALVRRVRPGRLSSPELRTKLSTLITPAQRDPIDLRKRVAGFVPPMTGCDRGFTAHVCPLRRK